MDLAASPISILLVPLAMLVSYPLGFSLGMIYGLVSTAASKVGSFWNGHKLAPAKRGARSVDERMAPKLVEIMRELSLRAAIPMPDLYIIDSAEANALAAGRDYRHAAICVTTGFLQVLTPDELRGVLAHELGHVLRRSALIKTVAAVLAAMTSLLLPFGIFFRFGIVVSLLLTVITPFATMLLQLAIARAHEYKADECGARLTGRPDVAAGLLARFEQVDDADSGEIANNATARVLHAVGKRIVGPRLDNPFSSHPLPANRIIALVRLSGELG